MTAPLGCANVRTSQASLYSGQSMNLAKTLQVQDQIIEQLRADQAALREALESERNSLRDCRITSDRELKALQREKIQAEKINKQLEMKVEELEKELTFSKETLNFEQKNLKTLEKEHIAAIKDLKVKMSKDLDRINKQDMQIDQLKSEIEDLKEALQSERNATNMLIREHNAEVKMLREEVRSKSTEAYRELKERATREREEYREMQEEAEKTYKVLERDFREALASKDEELRKVRAEAKLIQKELEDQLRASLKEPVQTQPSTIFSSSEFVEISKFRRLKNEVSVLKEQNRKLLNEIQILTEETKINEIPKMEPPSFPVPPTPSYQDLPSEKTSKHIIHHKRSTTSAIDRRLDIEVTNMTSDFSISKNLYNKKSTKSTLSIKKDEGLRQYPRTKTEERYEELKRTMQILRKALQ